MDLNLLTQALVDVSTVNIHQASKRLAVISSACQWRRVSEGLPLQIYLVSEMQLNRDPDTTLQTSEEEGVPIKSPIDISIVAQKYMYAIGGLTITL